MQHNSSTVSADICVCFWMFSNLPLRLSKLSHLLHDLRSQGIQGGDKERLFKYTREREPTFYRITDHYFPDPREVCQWDTVSLCASQMTINSLRNSKRRNRLSIICSRCILSWLFFGFSLASLFPQAWWQSAVSHFIYWYSKQTNWAPAETIKNTSLPVCRRILFFFILGNILPGAHNSKWKQLWYKLNHCCVRSISSWQKPDVFARKCCG